MEVEARERKVVDDLSLSPSLASSPSAEKSVPRSITVCSGWVSCCCNQTIPCFSIATFSRPSQSHQRVENKGPGVWWKK